MCILRSVQKYRNHLCKQKVQFLDVKFGGIYSNY